VLRVGNLAARWPCAAASGRAPVRVTCALPARAATRLPAVFSNGGRVFACL